MATASLLKTEDILSPVPNLLATGDHDHETNFSTPKRREVSRVTVQQPFPSAIAGFSGIAAATPARDSAELDAKVKLRSANSLRPRSSCPFPTSNPNLVISLEEQPEGQGHVVLRLFNYSSDWNIAFKVRVEVGLIDRFFVNPNPGVVRAGESLNLSVRLNRDGAHPVPDGRLVNFYLVSRKTRKEPDSDLKLRWSRSRSSAAGGINDVYEGQFQLIAEYKKNTPRRNSVKKAAAKPAEIKTEDTDENEEETSWC